MGLNSCWYTWEDRGRVQLQVVQVYKSSNDTLVDADILGNNYTDTDVQQIVRVCVCVWGGGGGGGKFLLPTELSGLAYIYNCLVAVHAESL